MDGPFHGAGDCDAGVLLKSLIRPDETTGDKKQGIGTSLIGRRYSYVRRESYDTRW